MFVQNLIEAVNLPIAIGFGTFTVAAIISIILANSKTDVEKKKRRIAVTLLVIVDAIFIGAVLGIAGFRTSVYYCNLGCFGEVSPYFPFFMCVEFVFILVLLGYIAFFSKAKKSIQFFAYELLCLAGFVIAYILLPTPSTTFLESEQFWGAGIGALSIVYGISILSDLSDAIRVNMKVHIFSIIWLIVFISLGASQTVYSALYWDALQNVRIVLIISIGFSMFLVVYAIYFMARKNNKDR